MCTSVLCLSCQVFSEFLGCVDWNLSVILKNFGHYFFCSVLPFFFVYLSNAYAVQFDITSQLLDVLFCCFVVLFLFFSSFFAFEFR